MFNLINGQEKFIYFSLTISPIRGRILNFYIGPTSTPGYEKKEKYPLKKWGIWEWVETKSFKKLTFPRSRSSVSPFKDIFVEICMGGREDMLLPKNCT